MGVFLDQLETNPGRFLPGVTVDGLDDNVARVDLNWPMPALRRIWTKAGGYPSYFKDHVAC